MKRKNEAHKKYKISNDHQDYVDYYYVPKDSKHLIDLSYQLFVSIEMMIQY